MARTIEITDPHKPGDYQVINLEDWDPDTMTRYTHEMATPRPAVPVDVSEDGSERPLSPREVQIRAEVERLQAMTIADQGPEVAQCEDQGILERLREVEKRKTAGILLDARLRALRARLFA